MIVSIVCGTYNRLPTLQRMVESVRASVPASLPHEFVIVDNGSDDGTADWCRQQPDVLLMQLGKPSGAVSAFTEGAYAARGKYVLLATDDVRFPAHAIVRAIVHLETHADVGAVAFAHDKYTPGQYAVDHVGRVGGGWVPYPQIALVRRWLGDMAGWWGGRHPQMKDAFTYGGDNFLGAGIWERGYRVDAVPGVYEIEEVFEDKARQLNRASAKADSAIYHALYPAGVPVADAAQVANPDREQLRVLLAQHYDPRTPWHRANKRGWREAWQRRGLTYDYDFASAHAAGRNARDELLDISRAWQPHVILLQLQNTAFGLDAYAVELLRYNNPRAVIVNVNGDYWRRGYLDEDMLPINQLVDLVGCTNAHVIPPLCERDVCAFYLPMSYELVDQYELTSWRARTPAHDVVFLGNGYGEKRQRLAEMLRALPYDTGIYGKFPNIETDGDTHYDFAAGRAIYQQAKLAVSTMQFADGHGYVSNRLWEILAAGGAVALQQHAAGLDELTGLRAGVHYVEWHTLDELPGVIAEWLPREHARREMAQVAQAFVRGHHNYDARARAVVRELDRVKRH